MTFSKYQNKSNLSVKILDIYELNMYRIALFLSSYNNLPKYFDNYFTYVVMKLVQHQIYLFDYKRTTYGEFSLKDRGVQIWNNLPIELKSLQSYNSFKKMHTYL